MVRVLVGAGAITTVLILCGTIFLGLALWRFVVQERYRSPAGLSPVEREWAIREVEEAFAGLAPRVLLLGRLETAVKLALRDGAEDGAGTGVQALLRWAALEGFWRDLAYVSALGEEDPVRSLSELRRVGVRLDGCLEELEKIGRILRVGREGRMSAEGEKDVRG